MRETNWIQQADQAMIRAAARARSLAASTNTPIHIMKDGTVVEIFPTEVDLRTARVQAGELSGTSVVREEPPPYGQQS
jgi:hypothetical protein